MRLKQHAMSFACLAVLLAFLLNCGGTQSTTAPPPPPAGPTISAVAAGSITTSSASVSWNTDVASTSQVEYGTTTSYGTLTTLDNTLVTAHTQALSGLTASTAYHYRVRSKTASGQETLGADASFTTTAVVAPAVNLSVTTVNFGTLVVGTTSSAQTVTVTNSGTATLTISNISITGDFAQTSTCGATLAAAANCVVTIRFTPTANGTRNGTLTITDNASGSPHTVALNGSGKTLASIAVTPANPTIGLTGNQQFTATGTYSDSSTANLTSTAMWNSGTPATATISAQGLATAVSAGSTTISATSGSISGSTTLTVSSASLTVTPRAAALTGLQQQQFTASISGATWSVDGVAGGNATVGTISATGLYASPSATGTHTITATSGAQSANGTVYIQNNTGVLTWHNDNLRTGQNLSEIALTPTTVNSTQFGRLFSYDVDGFLYAQPLYVRNVNIPGKGSRNVVYAATEHNTVYAFDADGLDTTPLWKTPSLGTPIPAGAGLEINCTDLTPEVGITSTPVIDVTRNAIYVVAKSKDASSNYFIKLHALDLSTGAEKFGGPVTLSATVPGTGAGATTVSFDAGLALQRPALLLHNNTIYIATASHCDIGPYRGWILGYNADTLAQTSAFTTTPNGDVNSPPGGRGGIWMAGAGPSVDAAGNIYAIVGNGTFDADTGGPDYGDSFLKLNTSLSVVDYFTPFNQSALEAADDDVGSSAPLLLPDQTGPNPHLLLSAGKLANGPLYILNRDNMGHFQSGSDSQITQKISNVFPSGLFTGAAYWNGRIYFAANGDVLKSYSITNGVVSSTPTSQDTQTLRYPGATPTVTSNGTSGGIVWTLERDVAPGNVVLRAFNATNVAQTYFSSKTAGVTTSTAVKFTVPTIVNGRVYVGTTNKLIVFGLLP